MAEVKFNSNLAAFLLKMGKDKEKALREMGKVGVKNIKEETPVLSGNLRKHNKSDITNEELYFINDADYAAYVEFGSYKMYANPFMRRGIKKSIPEFTNMIIRSFKV